MKKGDHVIPLYKPECRECYYCTSRKTNLCTSIRATQGQSVMPDGTSRFSIGKDKIHHYMGCSTFSNFTVLPEIVVAKVNPDAPFDKIYYIGCGVTTGIGGIINTARVEMGATAIGWCRLNELVWIGRIVYRHDWRGVRPLQTPLLSGRDHRARGVALLSISAEPA
ncbi:Zn-dependent alcohol dehydrogenase [Rhizobium sp. SG570]|nr:Zn-dependent alcohol dehydrogenase [Rhizobium sp. SG570]